MRRIQHLGFSGQAFSCLAGHLRCRHLRAYGFGGLVVPLALLFCWLRLGAPSGESRRTAAASAAVTRPGGHPRTADRRPASEGLAENGLQQRG